MRFGIIGLGNHSINRVMPAISKSGNIIASVFSRNHEKGKRIADLYKSRYYDDMNELLRSDIDSVYIASPNSLHFDHARRSLESGKNVLLEKPMTLNSKDSLELCNLSERLGLKLAIGFHMRFHPALGIVKEILKSEKLGDITFISGGWSSSYSSRHTDPDRLWWETPEMVGGGSVMGTGVHVIDTMNYVLSSRPDTVHATRLPEREIIDSTSHLVLNYGGKIVSVLSSRKILSPDNSLYIFGEDSTLEGQGIFGTEIRGKIVESGKLIKSFRGGSPYVDEVKDFVSFVSGKKSNIATGWDGHEVVRIVESSISSSLTGETARLS
ncbi:MAG: Gfo/Idh/MocA family oxidoreductase [Thermoplasmataceae archaeon]|jgi:predicted dehydrogenase